MQTDNNYLRKHLALHVFSDLVAINMTVSEAGAGKSCCGKRGLHGREGNAHFPLSL